MNKKNVIKKDLLRRKIQEYFTKNPSAKSVIVKADVGEAKTLWKVVREGSSFKVVEVNTKREEFILESGITVVKESSVEFSNLSTLFTKAISDLSNHNALSNALRAANAALPRIVDPSEKQTVGNMIGFLTNQVDATTAGGGSKIQIRGAKPVTTMPGASAPGSLQRSGKVIPGKIVREDEDKEPKKKKDDKDDEKKSTKPKQKEPLKATRKLEPTEEPDDDIGLETGADLDEPQPDQMPIKQPSSEEMVVSQNLSGQTIKAANIHLIPSGGKLTLDLVSAAAPAELEWSKTGKVVFTFNGRPYVLKRD